MRKINHGGHGVLSNLRAVRFAVLILDETSFTLVRRIDEWSFEPIIDPVMYTIEVDEDGTIQRFTTDRDIPMGNPSVYMPLGTYVRIEPHI